MPNDENQEDRSAFVIGSVTRKLRSTPDKLRRFKILKAIGRLEAPWVSLVLVEALADPSQDVRDLISSILANRQALDLKLLYQKLDRSPWYVKSAVLKVLAKKRDPNSVKEIERILADKNADVLRNATLALGEIGGHEARRLLVRLSKDSNPYVRGSAEEALRKTTEVKFC